MVGAGRGRRDAGPDELPGRALNDTTIVLHGVSVDDSRSARAFVHRILERAGASAPGSAEEAIEYLSRLRPDVIFMDHLMPGMDGFQAVA